MLNGNDHFNDNYQLTSCPLIPLMNFTSAVRGPSALIIRVNDTLRWKTHDPQAQQDAAMLCYSDQ